MDVTMDVTDLALASTLRWRPKKPTMGALISSIGSDLSRSGQRIQADEGEPAR